MHQASAMFLSNESFFFHFRIQQIQQQTQFQDQHST